MTEQSNGVVTVESIVYEASPTAQTNCDGRGIFTCPTGTCYTGSDGWIGCCSVSSCAARTTCINYNPTSTTACDINTGGCLSCPSAAPSCVTIRNMDADQYIEYCGQTGTLILTYYENFVTTGSMGYAPTQSALISATRTASAGPILLSSIDTLSSSVITFSPPSSSQTTTLGSAPVNTTANSISPGGISGITIGSVFGVVILCILLYYASKRYRSLNPKFPTHPDEKDNGKKNGSDISTHWSPALTSVAFHNGEGDRKETNLLPIAEAEGSSTAPSLSGRMNPWSPNSFSNFRTSRSTVNTAASQPFLVSPLLGSDQTFSPRSSPRFQSTFASSELARDAVFQKYAHVHRQDQRLDTRTSYEPSPPAVPPKSAPAAPPLTTASGMVGYKHLSAEDAMAQGYHEEVNSENELPAPVELD